MSSSGTAEIRQAFDLRLHIRDLTIAVPPTLSAITTYVLLEQEEWFEKEIHFLRRFLKRGMTAIDIGANLGVYSLPMARLVGPGGRVFSYEPGVEARTLLERSRALNDFRNLEIIGAALSDGEREGSLAFAASSELRALSTAETGEPVRITSLDLESAVRGWPSIDFIKIDAEGEEERIVEGGHGLLTAQSPLVMFEVKAGAAVNERLRALLPAIGYRLFRQLEGEPILVPQDASQTLDGSELNLFAAKPDRVSALSKQGLLVDAIPPWVPGNEDRKRADSFWRRQRFASSKGAFGGIRMSEDLEYQNSLAAYATWRAPDRPLATRCAALAFASQSLRAICARACTVERASTWARAAWEWGARQESIAALQQVLQRLQGARVPLVEPFWPARPRFDDIVPKAGAAEWFAVAAAEQYERIWSFSSFFSGGSPVLAWLCRQSFAGAEMERRRMLIDARAGLRPEVPKRLRAVAPDHRNAEIWRSGAVPGTMVAP